MNQKTALLAGASGLVGNYLIYKLLQSDRYDKVVALVRKSLHLKHPKLDERIVDFDHLTEKDVAGADDVFCCLGTTIRQAGSQAAFRKVDFDYPLNLAKVARNAGASQYFLVSSIGANARSSIFYSRTKGEVEQAIAELNYPTYTIFRPSMLLGKRKEFRMGEVVGKVLDLVLMPFTLLIPPLRKYKGVEASTVASAMLEAAQKETPGKAILESDQIQKF